eukprot:scaffold116799_cov46-Attheya_sp.AAC.2
MSLTLRLTTRGARGAVAPLLRKSCLGDWRASCANEDRRQLLSITRNNNTWNPRPFSTTSSSSPPPSPPPPSPQEDDEPDKKDASSSSV